MFSAVLRYSFSTDFHLKLEYSFPIHYAPRSHGHYIVVHLFAAQILAKELRYESSRE